MKTIGWVYSHNSLKTDKKVANRDVRESKPFFVNTFRELVETVAKIAYKNRDYELFFRGQSQEYFNENHRTSILPSLYRNYPHSVGFELLPKFTEALQEKEYKFAHDKTFDQFDEVKWAIIQHYDVCDTPLLDITRSLRVACSFASEKHNQTGIVYVIGLPFINGSISFYIDEELINLRLLGICPPQALRPHFQEGFLAGTFPTQMPKDNLVMPPREIEQFDFGRRLIAKFEIAEKGFWDEDFTPIPHNALFPPEDEFASIARRLRNRYR